MKTKQDALAEVVSLIRTHDLTLEQVAAELGSEEGLSMPRSSGLLVKLFGYIGGLFIFSGLGVFVAMQWDDFGTASRIFATLGIGFCVFVSALVCSNREKLAPAANPLFFLAAVLQPTGILVMLREFSTGGEPLLAAIFMCSVMLVQQGLVFWSTNRTVLAYATVFFGTSLVASVLEHLDAESEIIGLVIGFSLLCLAWSFSKSKHISVSGVCYFFGAIIFLLGLAEFVENEVFEFIFLLAACGMVAMSTITKSRSLLAVGSIATVAYLGHFVDENFKTNLAGPIGLILLGILMIGMGAVAVRINNRYISK